MGGPKIYVRNAELMWRAFGATITHEDEDVIRFETPRATRVLVRRALPAMPDHHRNPARRTTIEDSWGARPAGRRMPVMDRPAGGIKTGEMSGVDIGPVEDPDGLADAERVIVDGFPQPAYQPWRRGERLPRRLLDVDGWTTWLARRDGEPAAAGLTFDDGTAVGVYLLATLPEHRSRGLGRAVMAEMLAAHEDRIATLVATEAGRPLYESLGFTVVSTATWLTHEPER